MKEMTDKEASIRMAEMCGYKTFIYESTLCIQTPEGCYAGMTANVWNPRENIAQAMEVVESLEDYWIHKTGDYYSITIWVSENKSGKNWKEWTHVSFKLSEAIFNAVKKYLEGEG